MTGGNGQIGCCMSELASSSRAQDIDVICVDRSHADITDRDAVSRLVAEVRPDVLVNGAAYTQVDDAESNPEIAMKVNGDAVRGLAEICLEERIRFLQISTDFVFGDGHDSPIKPDSLPNPLSVYGKTKLEGERACQDVLGSEALIVRTSWLYKAGHRNFVTTMMGLFRSRDEIGVVDDQIGSPTWGPSLAEGIVELLRHSVSGVVHYTDSGQASWWEFAKAIYETANKVGLIDEKCDIRPIPTSSYPTPATRPSYSVLDKSRTMEVLGHALPDWRSNLEIFMTELFESNSR